MKNKHSSQSNASGDMGKPVTSGNQRQVSDAVGKRLRALYDEALNEPVPSDLSALVERLLDKTGTKNDEDR